MSTSGRRATDAVGGPDLIDMQVIEGLRELGGSDDPGLVAELIGLFLEDAPRRIEELERGLSSGDVELLERAAHTLKSSSANVGACSLSDLCRRIEVDARQRSTVGLDELVRASSELFSRVDEALRVLAKS
jgi:HPt (histidine-containing phosphotransfer) domain-containing protein